MTDRFGRRQALSLPPGTIRDEHVAWTKEFADAHMAPAVAEILHRTPEPFVQVIYDIDVERMAFGRVALIGDAAFAVRPHAAAGTAKACADAWALRDALRDAGGDPVVALARWEPGQLALGRQLLARTRDMGGPFAVQARLGPGRPVAPARAVRTGEVAAGAVGRSRRSPPATACANESLHRAPMVPPRERGRPARLKTIVGLRRVARCGPPARAGGTPALPGPFLTPGRPLRASGPAGGTPALPGSGNPPDAWTGAAYGFPNVAMRSMRHSNSTRFSSIAGSRSA